MTDELYVYQQDQKARRAEASGARYTKGKRGGKTCRLGTDYMSRKELEKMNGEIISVTMGQLITVDHFKKLPDDLKLRWVNSIVNKYGVSHYIISKELFGRTKNWLYDYFSEHKTLKYVNTIRRPAKKDVDNFLADCLLFLCREEAKDQPVPEEADILEEELPVEEEPDEDDSDDEIPDPEPVKKPFPSIPGVTHMDLDFNKIDDNFLGLLKILCEGKCLKGCISIDFDNDEEDED